MCRINDSFGLGLVGYLLCSIVLIGVMTLVVLAGNAGIMLWRHGQIVNLWDESLGDIGLAVMLGLPIIPAGGAYAKRRKCCPM